MRLARKSSLPYCLLMTAVRIVFLTSSLSRKFCTWPITSSAKRNISIFKKHKNLNTVHIPIHKSLHCKRGLLLRSAKLLALMTWLVSNSVWNKGQGHTIAEANTAHVLKCLFSYCCQAVHGYHSYCFFSEYLELLVLCSLQEHFTGFKIQRLTWKDFMSLSESHFIALNDFCHRQTLQQI